MTRMDSDTGRVSFKINYLLIAVLILPDPGSFAEYVTTGPLGRFEGFLGAFFQASFTIVGPEYVSMVAGEAIYPRITIKTAFKTMYWRFAIFFIGGALCVGIVLPYNDPTLSKLLNGGNTGTAASSPYVIAMQNLGITVLPDLTNALMVTSIFSAGNSYVYVRLLARSQPNFFLTFLNPNRC